MSQGFTSDSDRAALRSKVGGPSGKPYMNRGPGTGHTNGSKPTPVKNTGAGYADGKPGKRAGGGSNSRGGMKGGY